MTLPPEDEGFDGPFSSSPTCYADFDGIADGKGAVPSRCVNTPRAIGQVDINDAHWLVPFLRRHMDRAEGVERAGVRHGLRRDASLMQTQQTGARGKVWLPQSLQRPPMKRRVPSAAPPHRPKAVWPPGFSATPTPCELQFLILSCRRITTESRCA